MPEIAVLLGLVFPPSGLSKLGVGGGLLHYTPRWSRRVARGYAEQLNSSLLTGVAPFSDWSVVCVVFGIAGPVKEWCCWHFLGCFGWGCVRIHG